MQQMDTSYLNFTIWDIYRVEFNNNLLLTWGKIINLYILYLIYSISLKQEYTLPFRTVGDACCYSLLSQVSLQMWARVQPQLLSVWDVEIWVGCLNLNDECYTYFMWVSSPPVLSKLYIIRCHIFLPALFVSSRIASVIHPCLVCFPTKSPFCFQPLII